MYYTFELLFPDVFEVNGLCGLKLGKKFASDIIILLSNQPFLKREDFFAINLSGDQKLKFGRHLSSAICF